MRQRIATLLFAAVVLGAFAPSASAKITITSFTGAVYTDTNENVEQSQAGSTPYDGVTEFTIGSDGAGGLAANPNDNVKSLRVELPPGLISNPQAAAKCSQADFQSSNCDPKTQIGTVRITVLGVDYPASASPAAPVYNLEPANDKTVSDFAFAPLGPLGATHIIGGVRDTSDFGLFFTIDLSAPVPGFTHSKLTFWGDPGAHNGSGVHKAFIRLPTACTGIQNTKLTVTSQAGDTVSTQDPTATGADGCDKVPFAPTLAVTPDTTQRDTPAGVTVDIGVPQDQTPGNLASAHVQNTAVKLPPGLTINPAAATGLQGCTDDQFGAGTHKASGCPAESKVGTVSIASPTLAQPLTGNVYLGAPTPDNPFRLFVDAQGSGLFVRLVGTVTPDPNTGQLTTTFANTPQVPFTDFVLTLGGGPSATLANPLACGDATTTSSITPYSGTAAQAPTSKFTVDADGKGGACPATTPFAPTVSGSTGSSVGGAFSSFVLGVARADGDQYLSALRLDQPPGLLGMIKSVPQCADADATAGKCPDATKVGTATVGAGAGPAPFGISGAVYLTGPYGGGPFGLAIVIHAVAGPFDLGTVVTRASIKVDPTDSHLVIETPTLPTILQGIPLRLRTINVTIDRANFLFNPTNCGPLALGALFKSTDGAFAQASGPMQFTGCDALPYAPKMTVLTSAAPKNGPVGLTVQLTQGAGEANSKSVAVTLPPQFASRFSTLGKSCPDTTFKADLTKCDPISKVGSVSASTPVLDQPLTGPVYLVAHTGGKLPTLEALLQGAGITVDLSGEIKVGAQLTSTFGAIPDVPITSFILSLPGTKDSALQAGADLCATPLPYSATMTGQNGKSVNLNTTVGVAGCKIAITKAVVKGRKAVLTVRVPAPGKITLTGKGVKKVVRTVGKAGSYKLTISRSGPKGRRTVNLKASFAPKKGSSAGGQPVRASSATKKLKFKK